MYGPWILAIIFSSLAVVFGTIMIITYRFSIKYERIFLKLPWGNKKEAYYKKMRDGYDYANTVFLALTFLCIGILIITCMVGGLAPFVAKRDILEFEEYKIVVEEAYTNGTNLDNIGMTETIIGYNKWLARAKTNKKLHGNFSRYYKYDIESMEYISVGGGV